MKECGTHQKTIDSNVLALKRLGWIVFSKGKGLTLTGSDLNET